MSEWVFVSVCMCPCVYVCVSVSMSVCLSIRPSFSRLSVISSSVCLSVCWSVDSSRSISHRHYVIVSIIKVANVLLGINSSLTQLIRCLNIKSPS